MTKLPTPSLTLVQDTGSSSTDRVTRDRRILVTGRVSGAPWQYSLNGGASWINGSVNPFVVPLGSYPRGGVQVRQGTGANLSNPLTTFPAFQVDRSVATPSLSLSVPAVDGVMTNGRINVGSIENQATWQYSLDRGATWINPSSRQQQGRFFAVNGSFAAGQVRVRQTDLAGNRSGTRNDFPAFSAIRDIIPTPLSSGHSVVLPDGAFGSDTGRGWTATGLGYDPHPTRQFFWVGNYGQAKKPGSCVGTAVGGTCTKAPTVAPNPSIVAMPTDASRITQQLRLKDIYPDLESIQGVTVDTSTSNHTLWFVDNLKGRIHNISIPTGSVVSSSNNIRTFDTTVPVATGAAPSPVRPNGIAYDPGNDQLIVLHKTGLESVPSGRSNNSTNHTISRVDKITGRVISSYETGHAKGADQLFYDSANRRVFLSWGSDPGHSPFAATPASPPAEDPSEISIFDHSAGTYTGRISRLEKVYAAEGISILPTPGAVGSSTLYALSDNYWENFGQVPLGDRANRLVRYTFPTSDPLAG